MGAEPPPPKYGSQGVNLYSAPSLPFWKLKEQIPLHAHVEYDVFYIQPLK